LRDIVKHNLEVAAQICTDISHRIIALETTQKPSDYHQAILRMGELGILPGDFARNLRPSPAFGMSWFTNMPIWTGVS
jgi:uncharacterized protein YutE (UPF0331/DUF86 family)